MKEMNAALLVINIFFNNNKRLRIHLICSSIKYIFDEYSKPLSLFIMKKSFFPLLLFLILFNYCQKETGSSKNQFETLQLSITDSIPLFKDSLVFEQFDINFTKNKILLFGKYNGIYELDRQSGGLDLVIETGRNPDQLNVPLLIAKYLPDGKILAAEILTYGRFYLFNASKDLIFTERHTQLFPSKGEMSPFICSNIDVLQSRNDTTIVGLGVNVHSTEVPGWEEENAYSKLGVQNNEVFFISSHFPLKENMFLKNSISRGVEYSPFIVPRTTSDETHIYLKFIFDHHIYLLNKKTMVISEIEFNPYYKTFDFHKKPGENASESVDIKQNSCNIFIESFTVQNNKVFMIYPKPVPPEEAPQSIAEYREKEAMDRKRVLHILDLKSNDNFIVPLPTKIDGHNLIVENDSSIYLLGNPFFQEDTYIYKASIL
jgi:hypothetical protein